MNKLKILKEIKEEWLYIEKEFVIRSPSDYHYDMLREEAIKWLHKILEGWHCMPDNITRLTDFQKGQYEFIKYFFGIKNKELK